MRSLFHVALGSAFTLAIVLSCSDDSPSNVDAATACEPPLAGRIVTIEGTPGSGTGIISVVAACPAGALRLGGGCEISMNPNGSAPDMRLFDAGNRLGSTDSYWCRWDNPATVNVTGRAWVTCLMPAN